MPRRTPNKYKNIKRIILGGLIIVLGCWLVNYSYYKPNISWERLFWLIGSVLILSWGLALFTCREQFRLNTFRIFVGMVFIFSGFVKSVDPLGSSYKFTDYFEAWHMTFMEPYALWLAVILSLAELMVGVALVCNIYLQFASLGALIFMLYFTPITLYLAFQQNLSGKELVHDCGCFGDAMILSNWQTFIKNIFLLIPTIALFRKWKKLLPLLTENTQLISLGVFGLIGAAIMYIGLEHLPIIDFRPYKIGTNIPQMMQIPPGAPQPKYDTRLFYKNLKTGEKREFNLENYPKDSTWVFVDTKNVLVEEGYVPKIHDFSITNTTEGDITDIVLSDAHFNFLLIADDLRKTDDKNIAKIRVLAEWCAKNAVPFRCLTSSIEKDIDAFKRKTGLSCSFYSTDQTTLKTIVRANPGLVLLKKGTVINNWHGNDIPTPSEFSYTVNK